MKVSFFVFNFNNMGRAAFRTFSAAHAAFLVKLGVGFKQPACNLGKGLSQKAGQEAGKVKALCIRYHKGGQICGNGIAFKDKLP